MSSCCHHPAKVSHGGLEVSSNNAKRVFTCPMHPKVLQQNLGNCSFCGMVLEPLFPSSDHSEELEKSQNLKYRFWVSVFFGLPIVFLSMAPMVLSRIGFQKFGEIIMMPWALWVQFILTLPLLFWAGWPIWQRGWNSFRSGSLNMFSLISIGIGVTFLYSSGVLLDFFPNSTSAANCCVAPVLEASSSSCHSTSARCRLLALHQHKRVLKEVYFLN